MTSSWFLIHISMPCLNCPPVDPLLAKFIQFLTLSSPSFKIYFNIVFLSKPTSPKWPSSVFPTMILCSFPISFARVVVQSYISFSGYRPLLFRSMDTMYCHSLPCLVCSTFPVYSRKEERLTLRLRDEYQAGRSRWHRGLPPQGCWDCEFESHRRHGHMSVLIVVCCQVEVTSSGWSLVQSSPTDCGVSECDREFSTMRRPWPAGGLLQHGTEKSSLKRWQA